MGIYHLGAASCFRTYAPHVLLNKVRDKDKANQRQILDWYFRNNFHYQISATSVGSAVALSLLVESPLGETLLLH